MYPRPLLEATANAEIVEDDDAREYPSPADWPAWTDRVRYYPCADFRRAVAR